jgi:hypothetical protein
LHVSDNFSLAHPTALFDPLSFPTTTKSFPSTLSLSGILFWSIGAGQYGFAKFVKSVRIGVHLWLKMRHPDPSAS